MRFSELVWTKYLAQHIVTGAGAGASLRKLVNLETVRGFKLPAMKMIPY